MGSPRPDLEPLDFVGLVTPHPGPLPMSGTRDLARQDAEPMPDPTPVPAVTEVKRPMGDVERRCPRCGGPVESYPTCHTWPQARANGSVQWMACMPCDSAIEWCCDADTDDPLCYWSYTDGLNPDNPKAADNELNRPDWLLSAALPGGDQENTDG